MNETAVLAFAAPIVACLIGTIAVLVHGRMLKRSVK
jgi:hypothetical protein